MQGIRKRIIEDACIAWEAGNGPAALTHFADDVVFSVNAPDEAASVVGEGHSKDELERRLGAYLTDIQVMYYEPIQITEREPDVLHCLARFLYRHRRNGLEIGGIMRHLWCFRGDKVVAFDIYYDALRMRAFYDLVDHAGA
jgi:ketosteroid isomerase-like protein